jgi:hypothetical protein
MAQARWIPFSRACFSCRWRSHTTGGGSGSDGGTILNVLILFSSIIGVRKLEVDMTQQLISVVSIVRGVVGPGWFAGGGSWLTKSNYSHC